jgi:hypothetical protein
MKRKGTAIAGPGIGAFDDDARDRERERSARLRAEAIKSEQATPAIDSIAETRQLFIDHAAIALHARGVPLVSVFRKATELWDARVDWLKREGKQA